MTKQRSLSDEEIGLVKAMLRKAMRNEVIHFYFNRPDRLISSGRIRVQPSLTQHRSPKATTLNQSFF